MMTRRFLALFLSFALWAGAGLAAAAEHSLVAPMARTLASMRERKVSFRASPALAVLSRPDLLRARDKHPHYEFMASILQKKMGLTPEAYRELEEKDPDKLEKILMDAGRLAAGVAAREAADIVKIDPAGDAGSKELNAKAARAEDYLLSRWPFFSRPERSRLLSDIAALRREALQSALGPIAESVRRLGADPADFNGVHARSEDQPLSENDRIGQDQSRRNLAHWNPVHAWDGNAEVEGVVTERFHEMIQAARDRRQERFVELARGFFKTLRDDAADVPGLSKAPPAWKLARLSAFARQVEILDVKISQVRQRYEFPGGRDSIRTFRVDALSAISAAKARVRGGEADAYRKAFASAKALDRLARRREFADPAVLDHFINVLGFFDKKRRQAWAHADPKDPRTVPGALRRFQRDAEEGVEALGAAWLPALAAVLLAPEGTLGGWVVLVFGVSFLGLGVIGCTKSLERWWDARELLARARNLESEAKELLSDRVPPAF